jgi:transketolase
MKTSHLSSREANVYTSGLDARSKELRRTVVRMLAAAKRGHVASAFSLVEILRVLYDDILKINPKNPGADDRDRCILSKGHGCLALYALLGDKGFFPEEELWKFCKPDGILGGHPEQGKVPGVEASTGSLGHGMSIGVGMALRARMDKMNHRVFVVMGDGECNEGSVWEAALCAGKHKLENLTILVDYNKYQSAGTTYEIQDLEPFVKKWESFNFGTIEVDGHDVKKLREILSKTPYKKGKPTAIICHTVKGKGVSFVENNLDWHHKTNVTDEEFQSLMKELSDIP